MKDSSAPRRDKSGDRSLLGDTIAGKYRVLQILGQGGFGAVFLVEIVAGMVGEKLAMKVLPRELGRDERIRSRFVNEIKTAMRLVHKYIIQIRDVGITDEGLLYYTMDYSPGVTLARILKTEGRIAIPRAIGLIRRVLRGLLAAHSQGVIHRDLKPANLMVEKRGDRETIRILDFGISMAIHDQPDSERTVFVGSPYYTSPEGFSGKKLGFYSDLYSVGVILYECVTGQPPYHGSTPQGLYEDLKSRPVMPPEEFSPEVAKYPGLSRVILKALEKNPENRYQSARDFFTELTAVVLEKLKVSRQAQSANRTRGMISRNVREPSVEHSGAGPDAGSALSRKKTYRIARKQHTHRLVIAWIVAVTIILTVVFFGVLFHSEIMYFLEELSRKIFSQGEPTK